MKLKSTRHFPSLPFLCSVWRMHIGCGVRQHVPLRCFTLLHRFTDSSFTESAAACRREQIYPVYHLSLSASIRFACGSNRVTLLWVSWVDWFLSTMHLSSRSRPALFSSFWLPLLWAQWLPHRSAQLEETKIEKRKGVRGSRSEWREEPWKGREGCIFLLPFYSVHLLQHLYPSLSLFSLPPLPPLLLDSLLLSLTHPPHSFHSSRPLSFSILHPSLPPSISLSLFPLPWLSLQPTLSISLPPSRLPLILYLYLLFSVPPLFPSLPSSFSLFPPPLLSLILTSVTLH